MNINEMIAALEQFRSIHGGETPVRIVGVDEWGSNLPFGLHTAPWTRETDPVTVCIDITAGPGSVDE